MINLYNNAVERPLTSVTVTLFLIYVVRVVQKALSNIYFHNLSRFPGPKLAAASTRYKAYVEGVQGKSWHTQLGELHSQYGPIVRVGPNDLHFAQPKAFHDIYNNSNRWDKEEIFYHSFGEDTSSFGFLTYEEAKERKDVLKKSFSTRAILEAQGIVQSKIDDFCAVLTSLSKSGQTANLAFAFRCMTMDIITTYCFGTSIDAIHASGFKAPIILAMDAALPAFTMFKHSTLYKNMIMKCPRPLSRIISPPTTGLVDLQEILETQIDSILKRPETLDQLPHRQTIYHSLLDPSNYKSKSGIPSKVSLYEEAQNLMFAGADTVGNTLMVMAYHLAQPRNKSILIRLQTELKEVYPDPTASPPPLSRLEPLPLMNAIIKESLRLVCGVISGLPRIVPSPGATICDTPIPAGTVVSIGSTFVHYNAEIFPDPTAFNPDRWLSASNDLDYWLIPFSRGPRSCLGITLAWVELRLATATVFRRFEMELAPNAPEKLTFHDRFVPEFTNEPVKVGIKALA